VFFSSCGFKQSLSTRLFEGSRWFPHGYPIRCVFSWGPVSGLVFSWLPLCSYSTSITLFFFPINFPLFSTFPVSFFTLFLKDLGRQAGPALLFVGLLFFMLLPLFIFLDDVGAVLPCHNQNCCGPFKCPLFNSLVRFFFFFVSPTGRAQRSQFLVVTASLFPRGREFSLAFLFPGCRLCNNFPAILPLPFSWVPFFSLVFPSRRFFCSPFLHLVQVCYNVKA